MISSQELIYRMSRHQTYLKDKSRYDRSLQAGFVSCAKAMMQIVAELELETQERLRHNPKMRSTILSWVERMYKGDARKHAHGETKHERGKTP